jgi:excisionase family DNA binding protein
MVEPLGGFPMSGGAVDVLEVPRLMTAEQVAALCCVSVEWVWERSRRGEIPTVRLGRYRRYRRDAILAWLEQLEAQPVNGRAR